MKTLQNQYIEITEGRGNKDHFLKQARHLFPELITVNSTFKDTVKILKGKSILTEAVGGIATQNPNKPDWFKIFNTNIKEAVGVKDKKEYGDQNTFEKIDKDVAKDLESNFDNSDPKNIDNVYGQSFLMGYLAEMDDPKNANKTVNELKKIVAKNMSQDINYYAKNGMFGVKGIGLETSKESKAPTGKYKSSGYGNLKENLEQPKKYKEKMNENKLRSIISAIIREELKNESYDYEKEINFIKHEVDYVPHEIEFYNEWDEPYRSEALQALKDRKDNFEQMIKDKLATFKENLEEPKVKSAIDNKTLDLKKLQAATEKAMKGDSTDLTLYLAGIKKYFEIGPLKENKLRSIISSIIREELKNESYDYETQADIRAMVNSESLAKAIELAKAISREEGVVQHVNQREDGSYEVSDWYDSDTTAFSYENGEEI